MFCTFINIKRLKTLYSSSCKIHHSALECHLPYGITQR